MPLQSRSSYFRRFNGELKVILVARGSSPAVAWAFEKCDYAPRLSRKSSASAG
jgi:hypothetical protein